MNLGYTKKHQGISCTCSTYIIGMVTQTVALGSRFAFPKKQAVSTSQRAKMRFVLTATDIVFQSILHLSALQLSNSLVHLNELQEYHLYLIK